METESVNASIGTFRPELITIPADEYQDLLQVRAAFADIRSRLRKLGGACESEWGGACDCDLDRPDLDGVVQA